MLRKPLLLAIDDEPGMLALIQRFAGPAGFDVVTNGSAKDAMARLAELPADVAIVDLRMPDIGGALLPPAPPGAHPPWPGLFLPPAAGGDSPDQAGHASGPPSPHH